MDKYDASNNDPYCYPNSLTLKNKLNIEDIETLERAERDITAKTIESVTYQPPPYNLAYMQKLHKTLFSELYDWAGKLRTVDISKNSTRFCTWTRIEPEANKLFEKLKTENLSQNLSKEEFCKKLAEYYCEINMIHPFREGNGRVQRLLFEQISLSAGYELNWANVSQNEWIQANIDGVFVNYEPMTKIFKKILSTCYL